MNTIMNMESFLKSVVIVMLVMFFLVGCVAVKPTDVSEQEPYISTLGYKFKSKIDLVAHGITYAQNYKGDADYVFLKGRWGIHGREVKFKKKLPKDAEFTVVGVLESYALFQEPVLRYEVKSPAAQSLDKYPLVIDLSDDIDSPNKGLDPEEFIFMGRSHGRLMVTNARREGS